LADRFSVNRMIDSYEARYAALTQAGATAMAAQ
jgi:hypothetical protein